MPNLGHFGCRQPGLQLFPSTKLKPGYNAENLQMQKSMHIGVNLWNQQSRCGKGV